MLFTKPGEYQPCGIFTKDHIMLIIITIIGIAIALKNTVYKNKEEVKTIIKNITIAMWIFEFIIIYFKLSTGDIRNVNNYIPLYYCSLLLYAGLLSSFTKGKLQRTGDVFLATGGIVGGIVFMIFPTTSLPSFMSLAQMILPFYIIYGILKQWSKGTVLFDQIIKNTKGQKRASPF